MGCAVAPYDEIHIIEDPGHHHGGFDGRRKFLRRRVHDPYATGQIVLFHHAAECHGRA